MTSSDYLSSLLFAVDSARYLDCTDKQLLLPASALSNSLFGNRAEIPDLFVPFSKAKSSDDCVIVDPTSIILTAIKTVAVSSLARSLPDLSISSTVIGPNQLRITVRGFGLSVLFSFLRFFFQLTTGSSSYATLGLPQRLIIDHISTLLHSGPAIPGYELHLRRVRLSIPKRVPPLVKPLLSIISTCRDLGLTNYVSDVVPSSYTIVYKPDFARQGSSFLLSTAASALKTYFDSLVASVPLCMDVLHDLLGSLRSFYVNRQSLTCTYSALSLFDSTTGATINTTVLPGLSQ